jgi:hypothetical protein
MNAAKDTEKEVEQQRIPVGIDLEPKILKALSPEEWMELQPREAETTNLVGSVSKPNVPIVRNKRKRDEKAEARVAGSHFLQPLASESQRKTGIDMIEPAQSGLAEERKNTIKSKKVSAENDESPKKIVELNLYVDSDDDESVPPGEEGTRVITEKDVLCGRGGAVNAHRGNKRFRDIIDQHRRTYLASRKAMKPLMNRAVVRLIRQEGGRFLKCDNDGLWYEIGDFKAHEKVGQAFRQRAPEMRKLFFNEELPVNKKVRQEQVRLTLQQQQLDELQKQQQQHLEEIQNQQQRQEELQMALARADIGTVPMVEPSILALVNPLLFQQAMTNPVFCSLLPMNQVIVPIAPIVNQALQTVLRVGNYAPRVIHLAAAAAMGNGCLILPRPNDNANPAVAPTSSVLPLPTAPAAAATGNGGLLLLKPSEGA